MQNSFALPVLEMLPVGLLAPHEDYDPRRVERLGARLTEEAQLKNPPVAGFRNQPLCCPGWCEPVMAFKYRTPHRGADRTMMTPQ
jgi:hypothetical protein